MSTAGVRRPAFREPEADERGGSHLECGTKKKQEPPSQGEVSLKPVQDRGPRKVDVGSRGEVVCTGCGPKEGREGAKRPPTARHQPCPIVRPLGKGALGFSGAAQSGPARGGARRPLPYIKGGWHRVSPPLASKAIFALFLSRGSSGCAKSSRGFALLHPPSSSSSCSLLFLRLWRAKPLRTRPRISAGAFFFLYSRGLFLRSRRRRRRRRTVLSPRPFPRRSSHVRHSRGHQLRDLHQGFERKEGSCGRNRKWQGSPQRPCRERGNGEQEADNEVDDEEEEVGDEEEDEEEGEEEDGDEDDETEGPTGKRAAEDDEDDDVDPKKQKTDEDD
ncbi:prothymosin alpha [Thamnophis elegans]|uniref:prothymosin alpha n=1 Tax=Thamnophis elegans TaxID=35005 RepID=UPI0013767390|nr:prothymosin alpha [Thamnophis elegans]